MFIYTVDVTASRQRIQEFVRQAEQDRLAHKVEPSSQTRHTIFSVVRALLTAIINLLVR